MKTQKTKKAPKKDTKLLELLRELKKNPKELESQPLFYRTVVGALLRDLDKGKSGEG